MKYIVHNLGELQQLATETAQGLRDTDVLLLSGPLGSGKTTFVKALGQALGIQEKIVSPTFTITAEYAVPHHPTIHSFVHADLYRLEEKSVAQESAVRDILERAREPGNVTAIEWAERLPVKLLRDHGASGRRIRFDYGNSIDERVVTVDR